jgi:hypothetical protein
MAERKVSMDSDIKGYGDMRENLGSMPNKV